MGGKETILPYIRDAILVKTPPSEEKKLRKIHLRVRVFYFEHKEKNTIRQKVLNVHIRGSVT